jgi:hydrogenase maturation protease
MVRKSRIICVGNRLVVEDSLGPAVFDWLQSLDLPPRIDVIDGGLLGLDLLPFFENAARVVIVDAVCGFGEEGEVVVLGDGVFRSAAEKHYDHAGGLGYLIRVLPHVLDPVPETSLVGVELPHNEVSINEAAAAALSLCLGDKHTGKRESVRPVEAL